MDTYSIFRQIADSWVLLAMFAFFIGCILWVFRPGARDEYAQAAGSIFNDDELTSAKDPAETSSNTRLDVPHDNA
ncbi:cbb3-type cytochrome c oxidase subunit 3 [Puniceibacterium sediminis]|uniref:Cytochrome c oxidase cbb3-type subunit 4 n=1 Tax=Puniceibacterium sediminis TaxID=1608407 RepID=A0A238VDN4_9RHOB|nr:cbb3-type cytochrome c oxidase subunit 3 [Puniceibacterium sediminis]SNR32522.1 cytochrome c oxidase cbb3-type subunit 4 [Puniceibacterium sediminis]